MKRLIVLLVVFVQGIMIAGGGSIYSKYGLGDLRFYNSARRLALGGLGTSLEDQNALNAFNPAGWNKLAYTRLEVGVNFIQGGVNSDAGSSGFSNADFSGFMIGFPVYEDYGISFAMGLVPFSSTNYEVESAVTDPVKNYNLVSSGSGSLSKAFFGATYKLPLDIMFGASLEYYTGSYIASSKLEFGSDATFSDAEFKRNTSYSGLGFTLGAISPDLSNELDISKLSDLKIGVSYNFISDLRADTSYNIVSNLGETEVSKSLVNVQIPERFSVGLSFKWDKDYLILADYLNQPWSEYAINSISRPNLKNFSKYSVGLEYKNPNYHNGSFWEQMILRGGLSYESTQYQVNGEDISAMMISGGFTIPLGPISAIEVGLEFGRRGTTDSNLLQENVFKLSTSVSIGETWFVRRDR